MAAGLVMVDVGNLLNAKPELRCGTYPNFVFLCVIRVTINLNFKSFLDFALCIALQRLSVTLAIAIQDFSRFNIAVTKRTY